MDESLMRDAAVAQSLMRRFMLEFSHRINSLLWKGNINLPQFNTMSLVGELGETTMGTLSKRLGVTMGASTNVVDKLVRAGYIERERSAQDRRVVKIRLTAKGREMITQINKNATEYISALLRRILPEDRSKLIELYRTLIELAESHPDAHSRRKRGAEKTPADPDFAPRAEVPPTP